MSWSVVVPTVRPDEFVNFLDCWRSLFEKHSVHLIVVEDAPRKSSKVTKALGGLSCEHLSHSDIPEFVPRQTDMIRSWGFYRAYLKGTDYVLTLDDDVRPDWDIISEYEKEFQTGRPLSEYLSVGSLTDSGLEMRGFPYTDRLLVSVAVQYGGWNGVLDYDAATQLANPRLYQKFEKVNVPVPKGAAFTGCIMNCAFKREMVPYMWQLPLFEGRYNRVGDIWSGLFAKKTLDHFGMNTIVINGKASVSHQRKSDPYRNLEREAPSAYLNDYLWENLESGSYKTVTDSAARFFEKTDPEYARYFRYCRDEWLKLFA